MMSSQEETENFNGAALNPDLLVNVTKKDANAPVHEHARDEICRTGREMYTASILPTKCG